VSGAVMPIAKYLAGGGFTLEQRRTLELAFNETLRRLKLVDRNDPVCDIVARRVVDAGKQDCSCPESISERAMLHF
jgi:hypothetical protein